MIGNNDDDDNIIPWPQAHLETCLKLNSLHATPQQVLQSCQDDNDNDDNNDENTTKPMISLVEARHALVYTENHKDETGERIAQKVVAQKNERDAAVAKQSYRSQVTRAIKSAYERFVYGEEPIVLDNDMDEEDEYYAGHAMDHNDNDDNDDVDPLEEVPLVGWNDKVIHVDLAVQCCRALVAAIDASESEIVFVTLQENDKPSSLVSWCRSQHDVMDNSNIKILKHTSHDQALLLAHALMALHKAQYVTLENGMRILALHSKVPTEKALQVQATLYQLDCAMEKKQTCIQEYEAKAARETQLALKHRNHKSKTKQALFALRKRNQYLELAEQAKTAFLNIEQTKLALEQAHQKQEIVKTLKESTLRLKQINQDTKPETVDDIMDDLQEEMELLKLAQPETIVTNDIVDDDDEKLLQELEQLVVNDLEQNGGDVSVQTLQRKSDGPALHHMKLDVAAPDEPRRQAAALPH